MSGDELRSDTEIDLCAICLKHGHTLYIVLGGIIQDRVRHGDDSLEKSSALNRWIDDGRPFIAADGA